MRTRTLVTDGVGSPIEMDWPPSGPQSGWVWCDVVADPDDLGAVLELTDRQRFDRLAVRDAVVDIDLPKVDDFVDHLLIVFHGLREDQVATYEVHCFVGERRLVTIHDRDSPAIESLWRQVSQGPGVVVAGVDELVALLADLLTRRLLGVLDAFDDRIEDLTVRALRAERSVLEDLSAIRTDLAAVRRVLHPQREALDLLRRSSSPLLGDSGRRRFSDVFDVASRAAAGLDEARAALAETLDAYRGAEARQGTEVTRVLTIYAAIMLPLSLVAGFFGMNFDDLPWTDRRWGWMAAAALMALITLVSLGMFVSLGWMSRPSGRRAGRAVGRGLVEATRAPVHIVGAVIEMSTLPLRATEAMLTDDHEHDANDNDAKDNDPSAPPDDSPLHGSE